VTAARLLVHWYLSSNNSNTGKLFSGLGVGPRTSTLAGILMLVLMWLLATVGGTLCPLWLFVTHSRAGGSGTRTIWDTIGYDLQADARLHLLCSKWNKLKQKQKTPPMATAAATAVSLAPAPHQRSSCFCYLCM